MKDRKVVIIYSNDLAKTPKHPTLNGGSDEAKECVHGMSTILRYTGKEGNKRSSISVPAPVDPCNRYMNAVDRFYQSMSILRTKRKESRASMSIFTAVLDCAVHDAYAVYRKINEGNRDSLLTYSQFKTSICKSLASKHTNKTFRKSSSPIRKMSTKHVTKHLQEDKNLLDADNENMNTFKEDQHLSQRKNQSRSEQNTETPANVSEADRVRPQSNNGHNQNLMEQNTSVLPHSEVLRTNYHNPSHTTPTSSANSHPINTENQALVTNFNNIKYEQLQYPNIFTLNFKPWEHLMVTNRVDDRGNLARTHCYVCTIAHAPKSKSLTVQSCLKCCKAFHLNCFNLYHYPAEFGMGNPWIKVLRTSVKNDKVARRITKSKYLPSKDDCFIEGFEDRCKKRRLNNEYDV